MSTEDKIKQVAQEILDYLQRNPNAADTLNGIANWWISKQRIKENVYVVEQALENLEQQGEIKKVEIKKDLFLYSSAELDK